MPKYYGISDYRQTNKHLSQNTPNINTVEKKEKSQNHQYRVENKKKIIKYKDLLTEIESLWQKETKVIPLVIGALGNWCLA